MNFFITAFLAFSLHITTYAQDAAFTTPKNASKKTKEAYKKAYAFVQQQDLESAIKAFQKLIKKDPAFISSYIQLGYLYERKGLSKEATAYFEQAISIAPDYNAAVYMALGRIALKTSDYKAVEKYLTSFLAFEKVHPNLQKIARKRLGDARFRPKALQNPVAFNPINLGANINSANREYFPSITVDDQLVYTVQLGEGNQAQEDLYTAIHKDGSWQKGRPIKGVNTAENEGAQSISADGKFLVFTVCNRPEDYGSCDLYFAQKVAGRWTEPKNIGSPINSNQWESQPSLGPNGNTLYFVRGGARGQGQKDIMLSVRQDDGNWSTPQALPTINTLDNEAAPCMHPDGKTLYFSSDGLPGMGGYDLYLSRKSDTGWTQPVNLGYPINTEGQEEAIAVNRKGSIAYLASDRDGGFGSLDIYGFELPLVARPEAVTYVKGITLHAITRKPLSADVEIVNLSSNKVHAKVQTPADGQFTISMPLGNYALNAYKDGFLFFSANYTLHESKSIDKAYRLEALLQPILSDSTLIDKKSEPIVLENVFFKTGSYVLESASRIELDKLKQLLNKYKDLRIQINGHTDNVGKVEDNLELSNNRAAAVVDYLVSKGIEKSRLKSKGYGETKPRYDNDSEEGRAGNRRTEFIVIK